MGTVYSSRPYLITNIILAGVILMIMGYSFFFSPEADNYPVVCIHEKITGEKCPTCGMSHAFSFLVRGHGAEASEWNPFSHRLFFFFVIQFFMRVFVSAWLVSRLPKYSFTGYIDAVISIILTLIMLFPLFVAQWRLLSA